MGLPTDDDIQRRAEQLDPQEAPPEPGQEPAGEAQSDPQRAGPDPVHELAGLLYGTGAMLGMRFPSLREVYTQDRCLWTAQQVVPALDVWGINISGGKVGAIMTIIGAFGALASDTVKAIKHDAEKMQPEAKTDPAA
jgi:hypothetical protein